MLKYMVIYLERYDVTSEMCILQQVVSQDAQK
jgi:hypothetical protein